MTGDQRPSITTAYVALAGRQLRAFGRDIKILHTLFSLPFLVVSVLMAGTEDLTGLQAGLLMAALLCARSYAMGINRLIDADIDSLCPRTAQRMIPQGLLKRSWAVGLITLSALGLILTAMLLRPALIFAAAALLVLLGAYPWMKRLHYSAHFYLGLTIGSLPLAVFLALHHPLGASCWLLGGAMAFWIAGFDILYALEDRFFDRQHGLRSIPARWGKRRAMSISALCSTMALICWLQLGVYLQLSYRYYLGLVVLAVALIWQLQKCRNNAASSTHILQVNAQLGVVYLLFFLWDYYASGSAL